MSKEGMNALIEKMKTDEDFKIRYWPQMAWMRVLSSSMKLALMLMKKMSRRAFELSDAELQQSRRR